MSKTTVDKENMLLKISMFSLQTLSWTGGALM